MAHCIKNPPANTGVAEDAESKSRSGRFPWRRKWQPTSVFLPGKSQGQRSLLGYSPWGCKRAGHDWAPNTQDWELEWKELPYPKYLWLISSFFRLYKDWWPSVHICRASLRAFDISCLSERPWNLTLWIFLSRGIFSIHHNILPFNFQCLILLCHKRLECSRFI